MTSTALDGTIKGVISQFDNESSKPDLVFADKFGERQSMKPLYVLIAFLVPAAVYAQSTNDTPAHVSTERTNVLNLQTLAIPQTPETTFVLRQPKPNEVFKGNITLSGIGVELTKTRHPLQMLNPFAPSDYGSAEDNMVRDPINGRSSGLKFFAIKF